MSVQRGSRKPWLLVGIGAGCLVAVVGLIALTISLFKDNPAPAKVVAQAPVKIVPKIIKVEPPPEPILVIPRDDPKNPLPEPVDGSLTQAALKRVKDATVFITVNRLDGDTFTGSGFLTLGSGIVMTNAHVLGMKDSLALQPEQVHATLWNGEPAEKKLQVEVLGVDREADLALLRFFQNDEYEQTKMPAPLTIIPSRKSTGNAARVYLRLSAGGCHRQKRDRQHILGFQSAQNQTGTLDEVQVNGGMHPGNSGGPVVDAAGNVVGIAVSGIRGTQIQFAIPCEKVFDFLAGRVLAAKAGEAQRVGPRFGIPVSFKVSDPLKNIQKLELEWWLGKPGPTRATSLARPDPSAGDGERHKSAANFDKANSLGAAEVYLPGLPPTGQVLWIQPVLYGKDGKASWGTAHASVIYPAPEAKPALLVRKPTTEKPPLRLSVRSVIESAQGDDAGRNVVSTSDTNMMEATEEIISDKPIKQRISFTRTELDVVVNGKLANVDPKGQQSLTLVAGAGIDVQTDAKGNTVKATQDLKKFTGSAELKKMLEKYLEHICASLETLAVPLPGGETQPGNSWTADRPPAFGPLEKNYPAKFTMTYTYRGVRQEGGRDVAVLDMQGTLVPTGKQEQLVGKAGGEAIIDLATGSAVRVTCTLQVVQRIRIQNISFTAANRTLELSLTRGRNSGVR